MERPIENRHLDPASPRTLVPTGPVSNLREVFGHTMENAYAKVLQHRFEDFLFYDTDNLHLISLFPEYGEDERLTPFSAKPADASAI